MIKWRLGAGGSSSGEKLDFRSKHPGELLVLQPRKVHFGGMGWADATSRPFPRPYFFCPRKVDITLPGKENSNSHGARPVHQSHRVDEVDSDQKVVKQDLARLARGQTYHLTLGVTSPLQGAEQRTWHFSPLKRVDDPGRQTIRLPPGYPGKALSLTCRVASNGNSREHVQSSTLNTGVPCSS